MLSEQLLNHLTPLNGNPTLEKDSKPFLAKVQNCHDSITRDEKEDDEWLENVVFDDYYRTLEDELQAAERVHQLQVFPTLGFLYIDNCLEFKDNPARIPRKFREISRQNQRQRLTLPYSQTT